MTIANFSKDLVNDCAFYQGNLLSQLSFLFLHSFWIASLRSHPKSSIYKTSNILNVKYDYSNVATTSISLKTFPGRKLNDDNITFTRLEATASAFIRF